MLIHVEYTNHKYDYIKDDRLDDLLEQHKIQKFRRSSGWAVVGQSRLRACRRTKLTTIARTI